MSKIMSNGTSVDCINLSTDDEEGPASDIDRSPTENSEGHLSCPLCSDCRNVTEIELKDHMWKHTDIICDLPENERFRRSVTVVPPIRRAATVVPPNRRAATVVPPVRRPKPSFSCPICNATYGTAVDLNEHLKTHGKRPLPVPHPIRSVQGFRCPMCSATFNRLDHANRHMKTHATKQSFSCPICSYQCARSHNLKLHMRWHEQTQ